MQQKKPKYDPSKKRKRNFDYSCIYRYDDERPNRGTTRLGRLGKENSNKLHTGGHKALFARCSLMIHKGAKKCSFLEKTHYTCPLSTHPRKTKGKRTHIDKNKRKKT